MDEPILKDNEERYCLFPIEHNDIWQLYKKMVQSFWTVEEIDLSKDRDDWDKLNNDERFFIKMILGFFAGADGIVMENLGARFLSEVKCAEITCAYSVQLFIEGIHSETYSILIDTYIRDEKVKRKLFNSIKEFPCIEKKQRWALNWINSSASFSQRLVAFACVEGIFFSGSFCAIYWLKKRGLMPGLTFSNELISRDEGLHTELALMVYSKLRNKLSKTVTLNIVKEAVEIEKEFICEALPCKLIGMNADLMSNYIEFVADRLLVQLGNKKHYNKSNPFAFMELISLQSKGNFFETKISAYSIDTNIKDETVFDCGVEF